MKLLIYISGISSDKICLCSFSNKDIKFIMCEMFIKGKVFLSCFNRPGYYSSVCYALVTCASMLINRVGPVVVEFEIYDQTVSGFYIGRT